MFANNENRELPPDQRCAITLLPIGSQGRNLFVKQMANHRTDKAPGTAPRITACEYTLFFEISAKISPENQQVRAKHYRIDKIKQDKFVREELKKWLLSADAVSKQRLASFSFSTYVPTKESVHVLQRPDRQSRELNSLLQTLHSKSATKGYY